MPAHNYTYSFEPKHDWSANYASSKEIYQYFKDFVHKYDLRQYLHCHHEIVAAKWDEPAKEWTVTIKNDTGVTFEKKCDFLINAAPSQLNQEDFSQQTPLHAATGTGQELPFIDVLLTAGANINARNNSGDTPLRFAIMYNMHAVLTQMLQNSENADFQSINLYAHS